MTALEYIRFFGPEFDTVEDSELETWLNIADASFAFDCIPEANRDIARAYYVLHRLTIARAPIGPNGAPLGAVTMEKEGDLTRQFATTSLGTGLTGTKYGAELNALFTCSMVGFTWASE